VRYPKDREMTREHLLSWIEQEEPVPHIDKIEVTLGQLLGTLSFPLDGQGMGEILTVLGRNDIPRALSRRVFFAYELVAEVDANTALRGPVS